MSALEDLGTIYRHASKDAPKPCISDVLALLQDKQHLSLSELKAAAAENKKSTKPKKPRETKPREPKKAKGFSQEEHLNRLLDAKNEGTLLAAIELLKKSKPTNENLTNLLTAYTGVAVRTGRKKDDLYNAFLRAFNAEQRHEARAEISKTTLPI
ncbi:hypothetical protein T281_16160 [Rhodomicrobium udaipurense JA643]|nr:hypothetical protein T281_16160 [Rhodomicrobium udaipurense JA643]